MPIGRVTLLIFLAGTIIDRNPELSSPSMTLAGIPGEPPTQTGFGALAYTTSPPTGLLGVGLGGDSSPRMMAFQARLEF